MLLHLHLLTLERLDVDQGQEVVGGKLVDHDFVAKLGFADVDVGADDSEEDRASVEGALHFGEELLDCVVG